MDDKARNEWAEIFALFGEIAKAQAEMREREDALIEDMIDNQIDDMIMAKHDEALQVPPFPSRGSGGGDWFPPPPKIA